jgi:alpha-ribazole phosphatase
MLVHLLRHGETEGGARYCGGIDVALSWKGWRQMRAAVAGESWDLIVSSPLRRCAAFAEALARKLGACCRVDADWREMSFGEWEGRSAGELLATDGERLRRFWKDPAELSPPGGEPITQLHSRVMAAWRRIVKDPDSGRVLIVTHGGPIRVLRAMQSGLALSALLSIDVPHAALVSIESLPNRVGTPELPPKSSPCAERETPA